MSETVGGKTTCKTCAAVILSRTAIDNDGNCAPCAEGYRDQIEDAKRWNDIRRSAPPDRERAFWLELVQRAEVGGLESLSDDERVYFLVNCLIGEVINGGFEQFFTNSSGQFYAETLESLSVLKAEEEIRFLKSAAQTIKNPEANEAAALDELDTMFGRGEDRMHESLRDFCRSKKLF